MSGKKGFTLMELLIAAAISTILMVFATIQYRESASEARWTQAKVNAEQLANAVQRAELDYENIKFSCDADFYMKNMYGTCSYTREEARVAPATLIPCGYAEKGIWAADSFRYYVCKDSSSSPIACSACQVADALVCVVPNCLSKLSTKHKRYSYCVTKDGAFEYTNGTWCAGE